MYKNHQLIKVLHTFV